MSFRIRGYLYYAYIYICILDDIVIYSIYSIFNGKSNLNVNIKLVIYKLLIGIILTYSYLVWSSVLNASFKKLKLFNIALLTSSVCILITYRCHISKKENCLFVKIFSNCNMLILFHNNWKLRFQAAKV